MNKPTTKRFNDLTGKKFGRIVVVGYGGKRKGGHHVWHCQCECGTACDVYSSNLVRGNTTSCGCARREISKARATTHAQYGTRTYQAWAHIKVRCYNQESRDYKNYGGRGITLCERWSDFANFLADMGECPRGLTIDRIDNSGNYEPGNCRWATMKQQANNKRNNRILTHNGITQCVTAWEEMLGLPTKSIHNRLLKGWTQEEALTTSIRPVYRMLTHDGKTMSATEWASALGIDRRTIYARLHKGWSVERVLSK